MSWRQNRKPLLSGAMLLALVAVLPQNGAKNVEVSVKEPAYDCGQGCLEALLKLVYPTYDPENYYYYCTDREFLTSMLLCSQTYCTPPQVDANWVYETSNCEVYGSVVMPNMTEVADWLDRGNVTEVNIFEMSGVMYNNTVLPDRASWEAGSKTLKIWSEETVMHHSFGWAMYILVGMMVITGMINRGLVTLSHTSYFVSSAHLDHSVSSRARTMYRKHLGTPALFGYTHMNGWLWVTVPTRLQTLFVSLFLYVALNVVFCSVGYNGKLFRDNLYWPEDENTQLARYVADRTGIICFYNLPLMFLFAGRNDIFIWATGWSYASMNLFHRWIAKVATAQALVHSLAWVVQERDSLGSDWKEQYWITGVWATITMCAILPLSIQPFRKRVYEVFLASHVVLAVVTLVLLFYHVKVMDGEYNIYLWFCVGVWAFERLARIVRMVVFSCPAILTLRPNTTVTLTSHKRGLIRLTITVPFNFMPRPGQHYYIYTPRQWTFWENHPFSLASWRPASSTLSDSDTNTSRSGVELSFLLAPQKGTTRRILKQLEMTSEGKKEMRLMLEGPYGSTYNFISFNHLLFVAGGSGITAILPYLYNINTKREEYAARRVAVIWAVRDLDYAADVLANELAPILQSSMFVLRIHVTLEDESTAAHGNVSQLISGSLPATVESTALASQEDISGEDKAIKPPSQSARGYEVIIGRPVVADVLRKELHELERMYSMAVLACGPAGMLDDMRQAVTRSYGVGPEEVQAGRLEYVEEHFSW